MNTRPSKLVEGVLYLRDACQHLTGCGKVVLTMHNAKRKQPKRDPVLAAAAARLLSAVAEHASDPRGGRVPGRGSQGSEGRPKMARGASVLVAAIYQAPTSGAGLTARISQFQSGAQQLS